MKHPLSYKIAPHQAPPGTLSPGLVLLHGRGADEDDLLGLLPYLDPRFLVMAVRAPFSFPLGGATWYETMGSAAPHPEQFWESYERLMEFIEGIKTAQPVDPNRIFLLGFSMGAVMSYAAALTRPDEISGIIAHSGYLPEDTALSFAWDKLKGKGFFVAHGTDDPVIGIQYARRVKELLEKTDCEMEYHEYPIPHSMSEESVGDLSKWLQLQLNRGSA